MNDQDDGLNDLQRHQLLKKQRKIDAEKQAEIEKVRQREEDFNSDTSLRKFESRELDDLRIKHVQLNEEAAASATDDVSKQYWLKRRARYCVPLAPVPAASDPETKF